MRELDLVPGDYRRALELRARTLRFAALYLCLVVVIIAARVALSYGVSSRHESVTALEQALAVEAQQQAELQTLRVGAEDARRRIEILAGLRGGIAAKQMFAVVDRATDGNVHFKEWRFARAGELVEPDPQAVHAGYFVVLPMGEEPDSRKKAWMLRTTMEIHARAPDHTSLARFVRRLLEQPEIDEVRVLNTRSRSGTSSEPVDFELAVAVRTQT